jgi:uncharacterized protein YbjT (DUF2867 family)
MVLVVGGTGRLGSVVCSKLLAEVRRVRVMTRTPANAATLAEHGAEVVVGDLRDPSSVRGACRGVDHVVASAHALTGKGRNNPRTVDDAGNHHLIRAATEARVTHFVFVSALGVEPSHPLEFYRIKHATETRLRSSGLSYTVLRAPAFMEMWASLIGEPIVEEGRTTIFGPGTNPVNFMSVEDVAHFVLLALFNPEARNRVIEIGGPENLTPLEVAETFERLTGRVAKRRHVPLGLLRVMSTVLRPFDGGLSRQMAAGIHLNTSDQTFDASSLLEEFPLQLTRLEELARRSLRVEREHESAGAIVSG